MKHSTHFLPVLAFATTAVAQVGWTQLQPATNPQARFGHAMTYDITRGTTVMFGGWAPVGGTGMLGDTWEWDGVDWNRSLTAVAPPARQDTTIAYDIGRARVVLFGGCSGPGPDLNDTWEFDGTNWMQMQPVNQPSQRRLARMEYDLVRARIVLFGGVRTSVGASPNETWEWDGAAWTMRNPLTSPAARWGHGMTYDFARSRIVLCGGTFSQPPQHLNDTWSWDGTIWTQESAVAPVAPVGFGLTYHMSRDLVVRFGGYPGVACASLYDGVTWRADPRGPTPPLRVWCTLAHDIVRGRTVMFGGTESAPGSVFGDTWEYDPGAIARWTAYGSGCPGTAGTPVLRPVLASLPRVGVTFLLELLGIPGNAAAISFGFSNVQWNGNLLPFGLGAIGMTGCTLHASPDVVFIAPATAGRATLAWATPNNPSLIGMQFFNQGFALDPLANPTGATVSNAGAGIIGPF